MFGPDALEGWVTLSVGRAVFDYACRAGLPKSKPIELVSALFSGCIPFGCYCSWDLLRLCALEVPGDKLI